MFSFIIYIFAISFQVAGALQLLISFISTKRENVIRHFAGKKLIVRDGNTKEIDYDKDAFKSEFKMAYLNKFSFAYIASGYLLGIWGFVETECKLFAFILIIIVTGAILLFSNLGIGLYVNKSKKVNAEITNEELEHLHIEPDMESISSVDIDSLA